MSRSPYWGNLRPITGVYGLDACIKYVVDQLPYMSAEDMSLREPGERARIRRFKVYDHLPATRRAKGRTKHATVSPPAAELVQGEVRDGAAGQDAAPAPPAGPAEASAPAPGVGEADAGPPAAVKFAISLIMTTLEEDGRFYLPRRRVAELERAACMRLVKEGKARWLTDSMAPGIEAVE